MSTRILHFSVVNEDGEPQYSSTLSPVTQPSSVRECVHNWPQKGSRRNTLSRLSPTKKLRWQVSLRVNGYTLLPSEPAELLRDGDVVALSRAPLRCHARGDVAARRRLEAAAGRSGVDQLGWQLPGDEPELFGELLGGWPRAVAAWTRARGKQREDAEALIKVRKT